MPVFSVSLPGEDTAASSEKSFPPETEQLEPGLSSLQNYQKWRSVVQSTPSVLFFFVAAKVAGQADCICGCPSLSGACASSLEWPSGLSQWPHAATAWFILTNPSLYSSSSFSSETFGFSYSKGVLLCWHKDAMLAWTSVQTCIPVGSGLEVMDKDRGPWANRIYTPRVGHRWQINEKTA